MDRSPRAIAIRDLIKGYSACVAGFASAVGTALFLNARFSASVIAILTLLFLLELIYVERCFVLAVIIRYLEGKPIAVKWTIVFQLLPNVALAVALILLFHMSLEPVDLVTAVELLYPKPLVLAGHFLGIRSNAPLPVAG